MAELSEAVAVLGWRGNVGDDLSSTVSCTVDFECINVPSDVDPQHKNGSFNAVSRAARAAWRRAFVGDEWIRSH